MSRRRRNGRLYFVAGRGNGAAVQLLPPFPIGGHPVCRIPEARLGAAGRFGPEERPLRSAVRRYAERHRTLGLREAKRCRSGSSQAVARARCMPTLQLWVEAAVVAGETQNTVPAVRPRRVRRHPSVDRCKTSLQLRGEAVGSTAKVRLSKIRPLLLAHYWLRAQKPAKIHLFAVGCAGSE